MIGQGNRRKNGVSLGGFSPSRGEPSGLMELLGYCGRRHATCFGGRSSGASLCMIAIENHCRYIILPKMATRHSSAENENENVL